MAAAIHSFEVHCVVFIRCTPCCHSFSFFVTRCDFFSLVLIRCHSLSFVFTSCTTRCHSLSLDVPLVCLCINNRKTQSVVLWEELRWNFTPVTSLWKLPITIRIRIIYFRKVLIGAKRYTNGDLKISPYIQIHIKIYSESFAFLIVRILQLFTRKVCIFLKK